MKLFEIRGMPDPSDYRSGDELDPRSPYYDGPDNEGGDDPLPAFLKKQEYIQDAIPKDNGSSVVWTVYCGTLQQAQAVVDYLKSYRFPDLKVNVQDESNGPDEPSFVVRASYSY